MPLYEYIACQPDRGCSACRSGFEILQNIADLHLTHCPHCDAEIRRLVSRCRAAVVETPVADSRIQQDITAYEKSGRWSHAAELADKHAEKTKDPQLKSRALDNYRKAGYDPAD